MSFESAHAETKQTRQDLAIRTKQSNKDSKTAQTLCTLQFTSLIQSSIQLNNSTENITLRMRTMLFLVLRLEQKIIFY